MYRYAKLKTVLREFKIQRNFDFECQLKKLL